MKENDWKSRLGVVYSTNPNFQYETAPEAEAETLPPAKQRLIVDEWNWFLTPTLRFQHMKGDDRIFLGASGYTQRPSSSRMLPVLNITDPSSLVVGNVYLRPFSITYLSANWNRNNKKKFSNLMVYLSGQVSSNPIT